MIQKIDGKDLAEKLLLELKGKPKPKKILAAVLVGDNPASISFLKQKEKIAHELGVDFRLYQFNKPEQLTNDFLRAEVGKISHQKSIGGVLVQLPLPTSLNRHYVLNAVPREKDVDVLGERALGAYYANRNPVLPTVVSTVQRVLEFVEFDVSHKKIAVVGLGFLVGQPIATYLMARASDLYLLDQGFDPAILKECDLVISCVGRTGLIQPSALKEGAGVIDFGYSFLGGKIKGDLEVDDPALSKLSFYTPTPGGTGPILVTQLFRNFYLLNPYDTTTLE
ncbi:MAG: hypothetical protein A3H06_02205 [Candidatus Colwellbacteria bacterium RIFCSPLOWO2_12_FULL_44_13]|uniref:Methenyltetrahydrofolate cyclohydrolase n=3 Tax=Candidatus Colwelliibacteriota TaxID=1817904 RepID=A0A1G1Z4L2_9BACT|nr:MAG: hypothetical protein A3F24_01800 [Candidatus Colwellbacteria bacterium RIFCSPHIGHO2_12_FULL_44_17]OGY59349.1 MAG: hypothetical protein A3I31_01775 [Candidatus Colwellbacteria bacterium RIFCSPLOWO2_02_FULL_44_20b]OGY61233.1 MAG: hypothetical protein A3H06_02205 [Candidatus Colwellbacteria bacterium RIFCSPLOWO2_12_FULL_44_13]